jgi:hypothetical protein
MARRSQNRFLQPDVWGKRSAPSTYDAPLYRLADFDRPISKRVDYSVEHGFKSQFELGVVDDGCGAKCVCEESIKGILGETARTLDRVDWAILDSPTSFPAPKPEMGQMPPPPLRPKLEAIKPPRLVSPPPPLRELVNVPRTILGNLIPPLRKRQVISAVEAEEARYSAAVALWQEECDAIEKRNKLSSEIYEEKVAAQAKSREMKQYDAALAHWQEQSNELNNEYQMDCQEWKRAKDRYDAAARREIEQLRALRNAYSERQSKSIESVTELVLRKSKYPAAFPRDFKVEFNEENKVAIVTFQLPDFQSIEIQRDRKTRERRPATRLWLHIAARGLEAA